MPLRIYNTLSQAKEPFRTVDPSGKKVGMYVCGPTVYSNSHVGHMVGPVIFDTIKRFLRFRGYDVTWVVNITDIDDKLINQAKKDGTSVKDLAERVTADYLKCLAALGVDGIDHMPRATRRRVLLLARHSRDVHARARHRLFADLPRHSRCNGPGDHVALIERILEIIGNHAADFLRITGS